MEKFKPFIGSMKISREKIIQLSNLYCFNMDDELIDETIKEFEEIDNQLALLEKVDTSNTEPMVYPFETPTTYLREDTDWESVDKELLFKNAPEHEEGYFIVPKVVG